MPAEYRYRLTCTRLPTPGRWAFVHEWYRTLPEALDRFTAQQQCGWETVRLTALRIEPVAGHKRVIAVGQQLPLYPRHLEHERNA